MQKECQKQPGKESEMVPSQTGARGNSLPSSHTPAVLLRFCLPINKVTN